MLRYLFFLDGTSEHHLRLMRFLDQRLHPDEILFVFVGISCDPEQIAGVDNAYVEDFLHPSSRTIDAMSDCRRMVIVGLFDPKLCLYLLRHASLLDKTAIVLHGGEFYGLRGRISPQRRIFHAVRRCIIPKAYACGTFTTADYEMGRRYFDLPERHYLVELPWHFEVSESGASRLPKSSDPYLILVGHNAKKEDHTLEALESLRPYADENIKIIAPVSYGNMEYRQEVLRLGTELFGSKFQPLLERIDPSEYEKMMQSVSVFVMGVDRQAGTFSVNLMLRLGCKVYARTDTTLWTYFTDECGCTMFDINEVGKVPFSEFVHFDENARLTTADAIAKKLTPDSCWASWKALLES